MVSCVSSYFTLLLTVFAGDWAFDRTQLHTQPRLHPLHGSLRKRPGAVLVQVSESLVLLKLGLKAGGKSGKYA